MRFYGKYEVLYICIGVVGTVLVFLLTLPLVNREPNPPTVVEQLIAEVSLLQKDIAVLKAEQIEYETRLGNIYHAILTGTVHQLAWEITEKGNCCKEEQCE